MSERVTELRIIESEKNIFDTEDMTYEIPLYQRAYAWEEKHLCQLLEDISDVPDDANYYIGTLIVAEQEKEKKYEVVDGQQRLTSLYLLLNCLGIEVKNTLTFACRENSNYTLKNINALLNNESELDEKKIEQTIKEGAKILNRELNKPDYKKEEILEKLKRVVLYRIEVPEHTDLNRYFEIMNTRGEQLEQHDILKATLMSYLQNDKDRSIFASIWNACSDMTGYVQMHFKSQGNTVRECFFGYYWQEMPSDNWDKYRAANLPSLLTEGNDYRISNIIKSGFTVEDDDGYSEDESKVRFESIIEFPYFLLHTLKVLIHTRRIRHEDGSSAIIAELLDDKKLVDSFKRVIEHGVTDAGRLSDDKASFSKDFIVCLLRTRYLFDKFIIKREKVDESADGEWSMKSLSASTKRSYKAPYYKNSEFRRFRERKIENIVLRTKTNIMIQSALRVSYTSPKGMHWITELLSWLSENDYEHSVRNRNDMAEYDAVAEKIARDAVIKNFFNVCKDGCYAMGVNTPHIVFNYLDFLLWKKFRTNNARQYNDFVFEFRNSVEHWYPQNPTEGTFEQWKDGVDRFGNLCIIQKGVNSKFSNLSPEAKKSTYKDDISKGSLKLREMSTLTKEQGDKPASLCWKEAICEKHENEMLGYLKEACGIEKRQS